MVQLIGKALDRDPGSQLPFGPAPATAGILRVEIQETYFSESSSLSLPVYVAKKKEKGKQGREEGRKKRRKGERKGGRRERGKGRREKKKFTTDWCIW